VFFIIISAGLIALSQVSSSPVYFDHADVDAPLSSCAACFCPRVPYLFIALKVHDGDMRCGEGFMSMLRRALLSKVKVYSKTCEIRTPLGRVNRVPN
jgi:hypothetical protein